MYVIVDPCKHDKNLNIMPEITTFIDIILTILTKRYPRRRVRIP